MTIHPNLCHVETSQLLVVDLQARLVSAMPEEDAKLMLRNTAILLQAAELLEVPVLLTEQYPKGLGPTDDAVLEKLPAIAKKFEKTGFSCCAAEGFKQAVTFGERKQIILVGQETHVCVLQTALELVQMGMRVYVVEDAVCSRKPTHKAFALERMQKLGVTISNFESVIFEWLGDSGHSQFRNISRLLR